MPAPSPLTLAALRRQIATPSGGPARVLPLGDPRIDRHLPGGGLPIGQLHEIAAEGMQAETAAIAAGFAATLAAALVRHGQDGRVLLWIAPCCDLYAPGLLPYGIDPNHLIIVHTENDSQTLQTMETALRSGAANTVLGEVRGLTSLAARRLQLACLQQNTTSLLLRRRPKGPAALAAVTRWAIGQVPAGWERKQVQGAKPPGLASFPHPAGTWPSRMRAAAGRANGSWSQVMRRILCVWLPYWATTRLRHGREPSDEPLSTVEAVRGVRRLASVCAVAEGLGLFAGQTLTQARAVCPTLAAADATPAEDASALTSLAHWCTRATPLAAAAPPDTLWLDIAGCAHLAGGEAALAEDLVQRMARWGLLARWAIAGTTGAASALARHDPGAVVPADGEAASIAGLPIEALRLQPRAASGLRRLGVKTVAALARLPRHELAARFGAETLLRLDQAQGAVTEPIAWPPPPPDWSEQERFAEPILTTQACITVLDLLAGRLCARLEAQALGARQVVARFHRIDGTVQDRAIATALPVRDPAYLLKLLSEQLDGLDPGFGIEAVALAAPARQAAPPRQADFTRSQSQQKLAQLIDTLSNRLRPGRLWRYAPRDSHIPERAVQIALPLGTPIAWVHDPDTPRPIRLFGRPERIEVTAQLPDDPPVQFRWRGVLHRVRAATGPERIAPEWWTEPAAAPRDYYQVEDTGGGRHWLFRADGQWWIHGIFG